MHGNDEYIARALHVGVSGYLIKDAAAEWMFRCSAGAASGQPIDRFIQDWIRPLHREYSHALGEADATNCSMGTPETLTARRADGEEFPIEGSPLLRILQYRDGFRILFKRRGRNPESA